MLIALGDPRDGGGDLRRGRGDGPGDQVAWSVAINNLGEALVDGEALSVGAGGHVAVGDGVGEVVGLSAITKLSSEGRVAIT